MTLNERLREAFDKRVCGTAMLPASDLLSAMTAIEQAEAENAALKEDVAQLKSAVQHEADCVDSAAAEINRQAAENDKLKETIAQQEEHIVELNKECNSHYETCQQQAEAIRLKDAALSLAMIGLDESWEELNEDRVEGMRKALAIQPSPEILQARDERVAEACKAACENERLGEIIGDSDQAYENAITHCSQAIDSKEWRSYL